MSGDLTQDVTFGENHIFTPSLVNDARIGVSRTIGTVIPQDKIPLSAIGMSRFNSSEYNDLPLMTVTGAFALGYDTNGDQSISADAFDLLRFIAEKRLKNRRLAVIDATNVRPADRKVWIEIDGRRRRLEQRGWEHFA